MKSNGFQTALLFGLAVLLVGAGGLLYLVRGGSGEGRDVIIPRHSNLAQVATILHHDEIISNPMVFKLLMRFTGGNHKVRAGEFHFSRGMSLLGALRVVYYGEPILHPVTVPEGWAVHQIAQVLAKAGLVDEKKFLSLTMTPQAAAKYHINGPSLEGYLYPDTYKVSRIDGEERIVDMMVKHFFAIYDNSMKERAASVHWTMEQVVTLASIIEKETGAPDERPIISSVFHNRLTKHMRLQTDPTVIYGLGDKYDGNIHKRDLLTPTAYNTYTIPALPPGPIASPGVAAIHAALWPSTTKFLYFVSNNHGTHLFSETYGEHAKRVNQWQVEYFRKPNRQIGGLPHK